MESRKTKKMGKSKKTKLFPLFCALLAAACFVVSCAGTPKSADDKPVVQEEPKKESTAAAGETTSLAQLNETLQAAREKRDEIIENEFTEHDPESYAKANEALERAEQAVAAGGDDFPPSVKDDSVLAYTTYIEVLDAAWVEKLEPVRNDAEEAQQLALKAKADVAVKDSYNLAAEIYNNGNASYKNREWKESFEFFTSSKPQFEDAAKIALEKKQLADAALKRAENKIAESEKIAGEVEEILKNNPDNATFLEGENL
ncbi:hypothetical protein FACS1894190_00260 [Spirochaetia bacterium]|nr:hypothetical protein FACS1894190_00260 [Spirochaetia bacterium]